MFGQNRPLLLRFSATLYARNFQRSHSSCLLTLPRTLLYQPTNQQQITLNAIRNEEEPVSLQAIEFWSTICDEEMEILGEMEDAAIEGRQPEQNCHYFIKGALSFLVPVLTEALTKQVVIFVLSTHN